MLKSSAILTVSGLALCIAQPALAQTATASGPPVPQSGLEEIVVTAQKREQTLTDVPIAVSVIDGAFLERNRTATVADIVAFTPGLSGTTVAGTTPRIVVRGIGTEDFGVGSDPALGVYIDDVYLGRGVSSISDLFDVARVEIVRGPQGTLFGRNTTAGAISITTRRPTESVEGYIDLTGGDFGAATAKAGFNLPLDGSWGLKFAGSYRQRDGFVDNTLGGDTGAIDSAAGRVTLAYDGENWTNFLSWERRDTRNHPGPYLNPILVGGDTFGPITSNLITGNTNAPRDDIDSDRVTLRLRRELGHGLSLTSITGYSRFDNAYLEDTDASPLTLLHFGTSGSQESWSQEFRLEGGSGDFDWFVGASAANDDARSTQFAQYAEDDWCGILFASSCLTAIGAAGAPSVRESSIARSESRAFGLYGDVTWNATERLDLIAGVRISRDEKDFSVRYDVGSNALGPVILTPPAPAVLATLGRLSADGTLNQSLDNTEVQPRIALNYDVTDRISAYGSITRGYKSGGFNQIQPGPAFQPESITSYEIGLKGDAFDRRLRFDAAAYYYDYKDLQVLINIGGSVVTRNAATAEGYGLELGFTALPADWVTMSGSLTLQRAEYGAFRPSPSENFTGNRLVRSPDVTASFVVDIDKPIAANIALLGRLETSYRNSQFFRPANSAFSEQDAYTLANLSVGLRFGEGLEARLFAQNLFDEEYLVDAQEVVPGLISYSQRGEPRFAGLQLIARFR